MITNIDTDLTFKLEKDQQKSCIMNIDGSSLSSVSNIPIFFRKNVIKVKFNQNGSLMDCYIIGYIMPNDNLIKSLLMMIDSTDIASINFSNEFYKKLSLNFKISEANVKKIIIDNKLTYPIEIYKNSIKQDSNIVGSPLLKNDILRLETIKNIGSDKIRLNLSKMILVIRILVIMF